VVFPLKPANGDDAKGDSWLEHPNPFNPE